MNPCDPSLYRAHPCGYACVACGASANIGHAVKHSSICEIAASEYTLPSDQEPETNSARIGPAGRKALEQATRFAKRWEAQHERNLRALAKDGTLRAVYSEAQIAAAVDRGVISVSDAMNQDM